MTYRRSLGIRALSLACLILFTLLGFAHFFSGGRFLSFGGLLLSILFALSLVATLLNLGDRYRIDDQGIQYANPLVARLGLSLDRKVAWPEIVTMRPFRGIRMGVREEKVSALFLTVAGGRRFVIDSVENFEEVQRVIATRLGGIPQGKASPEAHTEPDRRDPAVPLR